MLRLSKLTDYGTVIMTHMGREPSHVYSAAEVAAATGVTGSTASKILKILARENLLQSQRGAQGGYLLSRPPSEISIAQVIEAMEGPMGMTECGVAAGLCTQESSCSLRGNWQRVNRVIRDALGKLTLVDMAQPVFGPGDIGELHHHHQHPQTPSG